MRSPEKVAALLQFLKLFMKKTALTLLLILFFGSAYVEAKIIDPSTSLSRPPVTSEVANRATKVPILTPEAAIKEKPQAFEVPFDEVHATAEFAGARLVTGTKDGKLAAFTIEQKDDGYEVVELSQRELAWQLGKVVASWTIVATLLFTVLFAIADKSRRR